MRSGTKRDPNAMEVGALSKGGKSKSGKGKHFTCWVLAAKTWSHESRRPLQQGQSSAASEGGKVECYNFARDCAFTQRKHVMEKGQRQWQHERQRQEQEHAVS